MISNSQHRQLQPISSISFWASFGLAPGVGMNLIICDTAGCGKPKKIQLGTKTGNVFPEAIAMPQTL